MKFILPILVILLNASFCLAQTNGIKLQRASIKLKLAVDDKQYYETDIAESPYITGDDILQIYPGESVYVEVEQKDGIISSVKCVSKNTHPEKTLKVEFSQSMNGKIHELMMLRVDNPFDMILSYNARMFLMKQNKWVETSIVPIQPKLAGHEIWPDVIVTIALSDWKLSRKQ